MNGDSAGWSEEQHPFRNRSLNNRSLGFFALGLIGLAILGVIGALLIRSWLGSSNDDTNRYGVPREVTPRADLTDLEKTNISIYQKALPSVVNVNTSAFRRDLFLQDKEVAQGTGSGFIWDDGGHIVTNYHVVASVLGSNGQRSTGRIRVTLADGSGYLAAYIAGAADRDLAVLRVNAPKAKLVRIPVGRSDNLQVGQMVYAIGNPFGLSHTMTRGIVSALGREIESQIEKRAIRDVIQTDAAINPGNSGGPLLDSSGLLIGVNTAIASPSGGSAGIGFAIPVAEVNRVVPQLIRHGRVIRPGIGVRLASDQLAQQLGVKQGALVVGISPGSPAQMVGLRPTLRDEDGRIVLGDVILAINEEEIRKVDDVFRLLEKFKVGDTIKLKLQREDRIVDQELTLAQVS